MRMMMIARVELGHECRLERTGHGFRTALRLLGEFVHDPLREFATRGGSIAVANSLQGGLLLWLMLFGSVPSHNVNVQFDILGGPVATLMMLQMCIKEFGYIVAGRIEMRARGERDIATADRIEHENVASRGPIADNHIGLQGDAVTHFGLSHVQEFALLVVVVVVNATVEIDIVFLCGLRQQGIRCLSQTRQMGKAFIHRHARLLLLFLAVAG
mmetsp:Transcript_5762/g.14636  ORF Transcript_5762/g.14636 Transcript_5762/m.14636 type:complete len:214 (-) Transcript_5762:76-717(-)